MEGINNEAAAAAGEAAVTQPEPYQDDGDDGDDANAAGADGDMTGNDDVDDINDDGPSGRAFSLVQSRQFIMPPDHAIRNHQIASLCPSMDLVIVESHGSHASSSSTSLTTTTTTTTSSLDIYRTMSWQKVATIRIPSTSTSSSSKAAESFGDTMIEDGLDGTDEGQDEDDDGMDVQVDASPPPPPMMKEAAAGASTSFVQKSSIGPPPVLFGWSPNGQFVALARGRRLSVYGVEELANPSSSSSGGAGGGVSGSSFGKTASDSTVDDDHDHDHDDGGTDGGDWSTSSPSSYTMVLKSQIHGLYWAHVGRNHPTASVPSSDEMEREISWRYQSNYTDQSTKFLPPSSYYYNTSGPNGTDIDNNYTLSKAVPECKTPLSVLCVVTDKGVELFLHGRYHLMTLPRNEKTAGSTTYPRPSSSSSGTGQQTYSQQQQQQQPIITAINDLSYWLISDGNPEGTTNRRLAVYAMPFLKDNRYALQQIATLHTSIMSHIATLQKSAKVVADNWKTSLKPLDQKLQPLLRLLSNYGVDVELSNGRPSAVLLRKVLKDYILMGHTGHSTSIANAMDQFFTGVQMNDQLLQRMERSLTHSISNVETTAIIEIVRPTQALCWQIQELACLVRYFSTSDDDDEADDDKTSTSVSKDLLLSTLIDRSEKLWIVAEHIHTSIVNARLAIRDFCGWLRHASSQVKARGTAPNSVQRENARKRRVPQSVLERIVSSLLTTSDSDRDVGIGTPKSNGGAASFSTSIASAASKNLGLTEALLGLNVTEHLSDETSFDEGLLVNTNRPPSPSSVSTSFLPQIQKLPTSVNRILEATKAVFDTPLSNIPDKIVYAEIYLPRHKSDHSQIVATHSRIGLDLSRTLLGDFWDNSAEEENAERSFFLPLVAEHCYSHLPSNGLNACRHWFVIAQASASTIQLFALPVGWKRAHTGGHTSYVDFDPDQDSNSDNILPPFYLTTKVELSMDGVKTGSGKILQLGFYGDDGKSSLSSGQDSGTGREGRQKIVLLYEQYETASEEVSIPKIDLWTFQYDLLNWQVLPFDSMLVSASHVEDSCCHLIVPDQASFLVEELVNGSANILKAQVRTIAQTSVGSCESWLFLSGSRGIGGVGLLSKNRIVSLELLDLEDCEDDEDMDEE